MHGAADAQHATTQPNLIRRFGAQAVNFGVNITVHNLASGSSANSLLIRRNGVSILIDSGLPIRKLQANLLTLGMKVDEIDIVFVTHEHTDHIRSLPQLRRSGVTIMTSQGTARSLRLGPAEYMAARHGAVYDVAGFTISPCAVSHDASEPLGLSIDSDGMSITVLTDLGQVSECQIDALARADLIIMESNHDVDMLRFGPYPAHLKRRVLSGVGHLSNADAGKALRSALARSNREPRIWLAHLSETNNRPVTASTTVRQHIPGASVRILPRHDMVDLLDTQRPESFATSPVQVPLLLDG